MIKEFELNGHNWEIINNNIYLIDGNLATDQEIQDLERELQKKREVKINESRFEKLV